MFWIKSESENLNLYFENEIVNKNSNSWVEVLNSWFENNNYGI